MPLALFDLDNTLIAGDSDVTWGRFLADIGAVDPVVTHTTHTRFYEEYLQGTLDIREFCRFAFRPLVEHPLSRLESWRQQFLHDYIRPMIAPGTPALLEQHRRAGDTLVIITATNSFVTRPIAELLGVAELIATEPEMRNGQFTGELYGTPSFREGKVTRLQEWLLARGESPEHIAAATFYSDSQNDIPLLEAVRHAVAVDPDPALAEHARRRGWREISLRSPSAP